MKQRFIIGTIFFVLVLGCGTVQADSDHKDRIQGPVEDASAVIKQCLNCHQDQAVDIMRTPHWTWEREQQVHGKKVKLGKINAINNFCITTTSNRVHCSECHIGYGWSDENFDFTDQTKVDCLSCHDTTGTYHKDGNNSGWPTEHVNLLRVAQSVGKPSRVTCGSCHFTGGGGDAVKHGDLDSTLEFPERSTDVHMAAEGNNFQCQDCHDSKDHLVMGANMATSPDGANSFACSKCHGEAPHQESRLNRHAAAVACQTCHIPYFAKEQPTQMDWDWSTAGRESAARAGASRADRDCARRARCPGTLWPNSPNCS